MKNRTRFMRLKKREHRPEFAPVLTTAERVLNPNHANLQDLIQQYAQPVTQAPINTCFCVGPQPGQSKCPCALRHVLASDLWPKERK